MQSDSNGYSSRKVRLLLNISEAQLLELDKKGRLARQPSSDQELFYVKDYIDELATKQLLARRIGLETFDPVLTSLQYLRYWYDGQLWPGSAHYHRLPLGALAACQKLVDDDKVVTRSSLVTMLNGTTDDTTVWRWAQRKCLPSYTLDKQDYLPASYARRLHLVMVDWLSTPEVMAKTGKTRSWVSRHCKAGKLDSVMSPGMTLRINPASLSGI